MDFLFTIVFYQCLLLVQFVDSCQDSRSDPGVIKLTEDNSIQFIESSGWPDEHDDDELCYWRVEAPPGQRIGWRFDSAFELEASLRCRRDYVRLYDAYSDHNAIGEYCGYSAPAPGISTGRYLFVKFKTDSSARYKGFRMALELNSIPSAIALDDYTMGDVIGAVLGCVLVLICVIVICACVCCCCCRGGGRRGRVLNRNGATTGASSVPGATSGTSQQGAANQPLNPTQNPPSHQYSYYTPYPVQHPPPPAPTAPTVPTAPPAYGSANEAPPSYSSIYGK